MFATLLLVHSVWRWVVLLALAASLLAAARGRPVGAHRATLVALDVQATLGLLLFGLSPLVRASWNLGGDAMEDPVLRFWSLEHGPMMLLAVALAHIVHARARRSERPHRVWGIGFAMVTTLVLAGIPWPGLAYGRAVWPF
jgi:hypothetical protein